VRERENLLEDASADQISLLFSLKFSRRVLVKLRASLIRSSQEDLVQREPTISEMHSSLERRMMSESMLSAELLKRRLKLRREKRKLR